MNFLDLVKYTGSQTGGDTFTITLDPTFQPLLQGVEAVVTITDSSGVYATVAGSLTGSTFTTTQLLSSATGTIPAFTGAVTVVSSVGGALLGRNYGVGGLVVIGQSNAVGWHEAHDAEIDYNHPDVTEFRYNWKNSADTLTTEQEVAIAGPELAWARQSGRAASVSPINHMAKALIKDGGHKAIEILPGAEGATAFGSASGAASPGNHWKKGDELYERLKDMTILFLDRADTNYLAAVVMMLGESDAQALMNQETFSGHTDDFFANFKADILAATQYNMTMTPFIIVGVNDSNLAADANSSNIEASMADAPSRITRCSYISMVGQPSIDNFHHSDVAARNLGRDLFVPAYKRALSNWQNKSGDLLGSINVVATVTGSFLADLAGDLTGTASVEGIFQGSPAALAGDLTGTAVTSAGLTISAPAALAGDLTGTATVVGQVEPTSIVAEFNANVGVTANGSNQTSVWESINGTGHTFTNTGGVTTRPISGATGLTFTESNLTYMDFPAAFIPLANTDSEMTLIVEYTTTSDNKILLGSGGTWVAVDNISTDFRLQAADGTETYLGAVTNNGAKHSIAYTIKRSATSASTVVIDGTLANTVTPLVATKAGDITSFIIGGYEGSSAFHIDGTVHNIYFTDKVLTTTEINAIKAGW